MKLSNEERTIKKTLRFILEVNYLSDYEKYLDKLIAEQGIDNVFNTIYGLFCSYGDVIIKKKKISKIIQKYNKY